MRSTVLPAGYRCGQLHLVQSYTVMVVGWLHSSGTSAPGHGPLVTAVKNWILSMEPTSAAFYLETWGLAEGSALGVFLQCPEMCRIDFGAERGKQVRR